MISVLIPSRNELFLNQTIRDILNKARGEIEVIVNIDENWPDKQDMVKDDRVVYIHPPRPMGMRWGINACAARSSGEYLLKCDAHCMFAEGFDDVLLADMQPNWVVIPRRHSLEPINWVIDQNGKAGRDYHYLCFPDPNKDHDMGMHGQEWPQRSRERLNDPQYEIDDTPSFQGSCWIMSRPWFTNFLGGMSEKGYGTFTQEPQEIGMKTWLGGGEVKVNKKTWYAHLHKGKKFGRMYHQDGNEVYYGHNYSAWFWATNQWKDRIHDLKWFVDKFWPMPTWEPDWEKRIADFWPEYGRKMGFEA